MSEEQAAYNVKPTTLDKQKLLEWLDKLAISNALSQAFYAFDVVRKEVQTGRFNSSVETSDIISSEQREEIQIMINQAELFGDWRKEVIQSMRLLLSSEQAWREEALKWKNSLESHGPEGHNYTNAEYVRLFQERKEFKDRLNRAVEVLKWYAGENIYVKNRAVPNDEWITMIMDEEILFDRGQRAKYFLSSLSQGTEDTP